MKACCFDRFAVRATVLLCLLSAGHSLLAFRIEVYTEALPNAPVFLAGYYGDRVTVIDSTLSDASGRAVFSGKRSLPPGIYTLVSPAGGFRYDFLTDQAQELTVRSSARHTVITGSPQTEAYAAYLSWMDTRPDRQQAVARRDTLIRQHAGTFLAAYLTALQPLREETPHHPDDMTQLMRRYYRQRQRFFDRMNLSDVRLLHTPLYHETIRYYFSGFISQKTDTLIHAAYDMLEKASGNYETFFFVLDFLIDYSLRNDAEDIDRLYRFLQPSRCMLTAKALALLPARQRHMRFMLHEGENAIGRQFAGMSLTDVDGQPFEPSSVRSQYRMFYFWDPVCPRCLSDAPSWQALLEKYRSKSCAGIAVNVRAGDAQADSRLNGCASCIHLVAGNLSEQERIFLTAGYAKIIITDTEGNIIGIFGSLPILDEFLSMI
ncbi:MAG: redoxin domain-containing protein [Bacteroidales bacterium]|jgi:thiol-disulfide isomerase/thioredoxin|nr:redoxin domain-containing protein [Bacteroidales bacterium]